MDGPGSTKSATLSAEEREALYREYDTWVRAVGSGKSTKKCHLPASASETDKDGEPRPLCERTLQNGRWVTKDPASFPGEWARGRLCANCTEIVVLTDRNREQEQN